MSGCAAVGCTNRGKKGFLMKSFPKDPARRALWAARMNRSCWQPNDHSRLCEVHFDADQWEKTRQDGSRKLKCSAIPTLFDNSKQTLGRKMPPSKFVASSGADATFDENIMPLSAKIEFVSDKKSANTETKTIWKSILRQNVILPEKDTARPESRKRADELSSFDLEIKKPSCRTSDRSSRHNRLETNVIENSNREMNILNAGDPCCRLCASKNSKSYTPIFDESDLAEKISRCLPILVLPTDNLPLEVCQECLYDLNISYKLIIASIEADSCLRSEYLKTNNSAQLFQRPTNRKQWKENKSAAKEEPVFRINGPIKCDLCDEFFEDMNLFDTHIETTHLLKWQCSFCDHSFETSHELIAHKTLSHSGQIASCTNCIKSDEIEGIEPTVPVVNGEDGKTDVDFDPTKIHVDDRSTVGKIQKPKLLNLNCTKCKMVFETAKQFRKHHTIHLPRRIKCSLCFKRCPSIFDYLAHFKLVHNQTKTNRLTKRNAVHGCKYCKKVFLTKQQLVIHLRKHTKEMFEDPLVTIYKCVTCPKKFVDRALYQKHRNVHDPACWHKFRCNICSRSFMDRFKLKIHQSIHDGVKPYRCDLCGRTFNRNANMIRHRAKHFEQSCRHCEKTFANNQSLRQHLKDIHSDTLRPKNNSDKGAKENGNKTGGSGDYFICGYCGKQLTSYYSLLDHERIHTGDKPYVCQHCGKAFRSITARWDHMVRHEKGNYVCELCGQIISNKLNLRRHLRKHAAIEQKRFECKECGKLFHVRWRLNAHLMRVHPSPPST